MLAGVFVTAFYTFRMLFLTFHGPERFPHAHGAHEDPHSAGRAIRDCLSEPEPHHGRARQAPHESPAVVTVPLIALAIPSVFIGILTVGPVLFGSYFGSSIFVLPGNNVIAKVGEEFTGGYGSGLSRVCVAAVLARARRRIHRVVVLPAGARTGPMSLARRFRWLHAVC